MSVRRIWSGQDVEDSPRAAAWLNEIEGQVYGATSAFFGADNTGAVDATSAIQAAIDAASNAGGGVVYCPAGTYLLKGTVYLADDVTLAGDGMGKTIFSASPDAAGSPSVAFGNGDVWTVTTSNVSLRDFTVDRSAATAQHGFNLNGVTNWSFQRVEVTGAGEPLVASGAVSISGVMPGSFSGSRVQSKNVTFVDCRFKRTNNFGIQFSFIEGGVVTGCVFEDCYREVIGVEPESGCTAQDVTITGNTITTGTVDTGTATGVIVVTESSGGTIDGVVVSGNNLRNTNTVASNANPGILVLGADNVVLSGNTIIGMNGQGIAIGSASFATSSTLVTNNVVRSCNAGSNTTFNGAGISLRQAFQCVLTGNWIFGSGHTASIYESQSGAGRNVIVGNQLLDTTWFVPLSGSHSYTRGNLVKRTGSSARVSTATSYTLLGNEEVVAVTDTSAARTITLPAANAVSEGIQFVIKDESGAAGTNNITISRAGTDTIDGATTLVISTNYGKARIYSDGSSKWFSA